MVERRGLFWARKLLGLIWGRDLPRLNSLVANTKETKEVPWPSIRQSYISCFVMSPGMSFVPSWSATKATRGCHQGDKGVRKLSCWGQFVALFLLCLTAVRSIFRGIAESLV